MLLYCSNVLPTVFMLTILRVFLDLGQKESLYASQAEKFEEFNDQENVEILDKKSEETFKQSTSLNSQTINEINEEI